MKKLITIMICTLLSSSTYAVCRIHMFVKNESTVNIKLLNHSSLSAVKEKGVRWKALKNGYWFKNFDLVELAPSQERATPYRSNQSCYRNRRYKITYSCLNGTTNSYTKYYPSISGWTKDKTIVMSFGEHCQ